ncbi:MAG: exosortase-associated EpsI family protein [Planctomycetota bacterium]|jgi:hypothetical protein
MTAPAAPAPTRFLSARFVACLAVLLAGLLGLQPGMAALARAFSKERIELRRPLDASAFERLPSFRPDPDIRRHDATVEAIGTKDWLSMGFRERDAAPGTGEVLLLVTYYSNPRDTVPHTPEVCYEQAGALVTSIEDVVVDTPGLGPDRPTVDARLLGIRFRLDQVLLYTFCCNGDFYADRQQVRVRIGLPGERYTYFAKIEAMAILLPGEDASTVADRCRRLLDEVLAVLLADHFPTADQLQGQPADGA